MAITVDNYPTEDLIAGTIVSANKNAGAATYYRGQLLGRTDATGVYVPYNAVGTGGAENVRGVCAESLTLAGAGSIPVYITGTEVLSGGLVDASGDALTVTTAIIEACQDGGIIVRS